MGFNFRGLFIEAFAVYKIDSYKDCSFVLINLSVRLREKTIVWGYISKIYYNRV